MRGPRVDLWEWVLLGLAKRGFAEKTIGIDAELTPSKRATFARILPGARLLDVGDIGLRMRMIKANEEIALLQRAYPYLALGDDTVIQEGMTFSVEPGLYDSKRGMGVNPSDRLLVQKDRAILMSRVPFSREWSFLTL